MCASFSQIAYPVAGAMHRHTLPPKNKNNLPLQKVWVIWHSYLAKLLIQFQERCEKVRGHDLLQCPQLRQGPAVGVTGSGPALGEGDITGGMFLSDKYKKKKKCLILDLAGTKKGEKWFWSRSSRVFKVREAGEESCVTSEGKFLNHLLESA